MDNFVKLIKAQGLEMISISVQKWWFVQLFKDFQTKKELIKFIMIMTFVMFNII